MKTRILTTRQGRDIKFSELGFGSAPLGNMHRVLTDDDCNTTIHSALESGVTYFDTAPQYGHGLSETRIGAVLREQPRDSFLLSTKIGRLLIPCAADEVDSGIFIDVPNVKIEFDYSYEGVLQSIEESQQRLGMDSIDIVYIHDVDIFTHGSVDASEIRIQEVMAGGYRALEELRNAGTIKAIGAGVNNWETCQRLTELGQFDCFLLAGRYTLLEQEALDTFLPICESEGIGIILGGPYNSGILATGSIRGAKYNYEDASPDILNRVSAIEKLCRSHNIPLAVAALQFPLCHPSVVSVIPGGQNSDEVRSNRAMMDVQIPPSLWSDLKSEGLLHPDAPCPNT
jgi:D-threo-aldose 1-dehydrogenase